MDGSKSKSGSDGLKKKKKKSSRGSTSSKQRARKASQSGSGHASKRQKTKCPFPSGSPQHKAQRWDDYDGDYDYPRWSKSYDVAVVQASRSNETVTAYRDTHHPEYETEVTVATTLGPRRIDIADDRESPKKGIEHKMCKYTCLDESIASEVARDAELSEKGMDVTWVFEAPEGGTRVSQPLLDELEASKINIVIDGEPYGGSG